MTRPSSTGGGRLFACRRRIAAAPMRMPATSTQPASCWRRRPAVYWTTTTSPKAPGSSSSSAAFALLRVVGVPRRLHRSPRRSRRRRPFVVSDTPSFANKRRPPLQHRIFRALARRRTAPRASSIFSPQTFSQAVPQSHHTLSPGHALARLVIAPITREAAAPFISLAGDRAGSEARLSDALGTSDRSSPCPCTRPSQYTRRTSRSRVLFLLHSAAAHTCAAPAGSPEGSPDVDQ